MFWSEKSLLIVSLVFFLNGFLLLDEWFYALPPNSKLISVPRGSKIVESKAAAVDVAVPGTAITLMVFILRI